MKYIFNFGMFKGFLIFMEFTKLEKLAEKLGKFCSSNDFQVTMIFPNLSPLNGLLASVSSLMKIQTDLHLPLHVPDPLVKGQ